MDNPGSSILTSLGAGSGIDFNTLATDISAASFSFQRQTLETRRQSLETRISAVAQLRSSVTSLASALGTRFRSGDLAPRGEIGNPAVARATVPVGLSPRGSYSLEVTQLAQSQTLVSKSYTSRTDLVGEGTLGIRFGTVAGSGFAQDAASSALAITVTAEDTLATLAAKITNSSGGAINAYVTAGTGGARLVLKGAEGANSGFVLEPVSGSAAPTGAAGDLGYLGWNPASDTGELRTTAVDAAFLLDTVEISSPTNRVTGLPGGFGLQLTATNTGAPTTVSFGSNSAGISAVVSDLVAALNDIASQVNTVAAPRGGELGNDPGARELRRDLAGLAGRLIDPGAGPGEPRSLADLGVVLNRDGTFRFDAARLDAALEASPDAVAALFTLGPRGVFATVDQFARESTLIADPGSLGGSLRRFESQLESGDVRLARITEQQEVLRQRLTRNFIASERRVAASQSTLDFLRLQFAPRDNN